MTGDFKFRCKIQDWHGLHNGFWLNLRPGYTALIGPNGAGKTTLLRQVHDIAKEKGFRIYKYSNLTDGGYTARQSYMLHSQIDKLAAAVIMSEGENIAANFGNVVGKIGQLVQETKQDGTPLVVLLDALDSGSSIDRLRDLMKLFNLIERDIGKNAAGADYPVYILNAVNSYELAKSVCIDVRTGKPVTFADYADYAKYICEYFKKESNQS